MDLGGRVAPVSRPRRSLPVSLFPPSPSQLLSVLLCTLPLGLTPCQIARGSQTRHVPSGPQLLSPKTGVPRHACRRLSCLPQPSSNLFLSTVVLQRPRASGLGISGTVLAVNMDIQNKAPTDGWPTAISEPNEAQLCDQSQHHAINLSSSRLETRCGLTQLSASSPAFYRVFWGASLPTKPNCLFCSLRWHGTAASIPTSRLARGVRDRTQPQGKHSSLLAVPPGHGRARQENSGRRNDITIPGRRHLGRLTWRADPELRGHSTDVDVDNLVHPESGFFPLAVVLSYSSHRQRGVLSKIAWTK